MPGTPDFSATTTVEGWPGTQSNAVGEDRPLTTAVSAVTAGLGASGVAVACEAGPSWMTTLVVLGNPMSPPVTLCSWTPKLWLPSVKPWSRMGMLTVLLVSPGPKVTLPATGT